jgi:hypothetical protein
LDLHSVLRVCADAALLTCNQKVPKLDYGVVQEGNMPDLLHQGGLIMPPPAAKKRGVWQNSKAGGPGDLVDRVADFSYESDALAQLIVEMWLGGHGDLVTAIGGGPVGPQYVARSNAAKIALAAKGIYLERPIVITETEYDDGFSLADTTLAGVVVLVVPDQNRATRTVSPPSALLETAKMLMAVTPNGI